MVNNMVFRWPKPLFFMVLGARGINHYSLFRFALLIMVWYFVLICEKLYRIKLLNLRF